MSEAGAVEAKAIESSALADSDIDISPHLSLFRELGAQARVDRQVSVKAVNALKDSGFIRALLPKKWGGLAATPHSFLLLIWPLRNRI